jgi:monooxygenase
MNAVSQIARAEAEHALAAEQHHADVDVLIVGAGISGIGMAVHLQRECPGKTFRIIERRAALGGTWDLFRYPGIRSDSDMYTLGFDFEPWTHERSIAEGKTIRDYLNRIVDTYGLRDSVFLGTKVDAASWSSDEALWTLACEGPGGEATTHRAKFLYLGTGYYDYDAGYDAGFEGREAFGGQIVHPQFWPENLDYAGKKVVVIGSGATAVTIVPSMVNGSDNGKVAAHVTMLQRTPGWLVGIPARDRIALFLRKWLPANWAYKMVRFKNTRLQHLFFQRSRTRPEKVAESITKRLRASIGDRYTAKDFTPPYKPWEQRMCFVPDDDLFEAMKAGKAEIVTDQIDRFDATGIQLTSGQHLDADIIVTATGLQLAMAGKIVVSVDGRPISWNEHYFYKGCMFSDVPNLATVFGYAAASWTLKTDLVGHFVCRLLNQMDRDGADIVTPVIADEDKLETAATFNLTSGYIQRSLDQMPRSGARAPWKLNTGYLADRPVMLDEPIVDGVLSFRRKGANIVVREELLDAAE